MDSCRRVADRLHWLQLSLNIIKNCNIILCVASYSKIVDKNATINYNGLALAEAKANLENRTAAPD